MTREAAALLLFAAGFASGAVNAVAGGGSFLTLPILIFLGLPPAVANGTNRVAILLQSIAATAGYHRQGVREWRYALPVSLAAALGSLAGAWLALKTPDADFKKILAFCMVAVTLAALALPSSPTARKGARLSMAVSFVLFFGVGVYGGYVQAGVGFFLLAMTTLEGFDLVRGNFVKVAVTLVLTMVALAVFWGAGAVDWPLGLALGAGSALGGYLGARWGARKGHRHLRIVVIAATLLFAVKLWLG